MRLVHSHQQLAAAVLGLLASTSLTLAQNLVQNGDFDYTTGGNSGHIGGKPSNLSLDNWNAIRLGGSAFSGSTSYALVGTMSDAREDGAGIPSAYGGAPGYPLGNLNLRGTSLPGSPTGGNVVLVSADQSWVKTALTQWVNLTENTEYTLTFDWAAGQQLGFNGNAQTRWVSWLGSDERSTLFANIGDGGFEGWTSETFTFMYTGVTGPVELGFVAEGYGGGNPMALLDNVRLTAAVVPEPGEYAAVFGGLILVAGVARRLRAAKAV